MHRMGAGWGAQGGCSLCTGRVRGASRGCTGECRGVYVGRVQGLHEGVQGCARERVQWGARSAGGAQGGGAGVRIWGTGGLPSTAAHLRAAACWPRLQGVGPPQDPATQIGVRGASPCYPGGAAGGADALCAGGKPAIAFPPELSGLAKQSGAARARPELELEFVRDRHPQTLGTTTGAVPWGWHPDPGASQNRRSGSRAPEHVTADKPFAGGCFSSKENKMKLSF